MQQRTQTGAAERMSSPPVVFPARSRRRRVRRPADRHPMPGRRTAGPGSVIFRARAAELELARAHLVAARELLACWGYSTALGPTRPGEAPQLEIALPESGCPSVVVGVEVDADSGVWSWCRRAPVWRCPVWPLTGLLAYVAEQLPAPQGHGPQSGGLR